MVKGKKKYLLDIQKKLRKREIAIKVIYVTIIGALIALAGKIMRLNFLTDVGCLVASIILFYFFAIFVVAIFIYFFNEVERFLNW